MDAILGNIFLAVQQRIAAQMPEIKWIDQDYGQLEVHSNERPMVLFPCVLLDIIDVPYEDLGLNTQIATPTLIAKLGVNPYTQAAHIHSGPHIEKAIDYYNIEHRLNKILHGWCDNMYFTELSRKHVKTDSRRADIRVRPLRYAFSFMDDTAMKVPVRTIPTPDLNVDTSAF